MPRAEVRAAISDYLQAQHITFLESVFPYPPKVTSEGDILTPGGMEDSGAAIFLHLQEQVEHRVALGGPHSGAKLRAYTLRMLCVLRSVNEQAEQVGLDNDSFLDSLTAAIEANRVANSTVVFQWGEGDTEGGLDIRINADLPVQLRGFQMTQVWSTVDVTVMEILTT